MLLDFDYKDPKEISAVSLSLDSLLEPIVGYAKGISGTVRFDPQHPERSSGKLAVDVNSVQFANDGYTATARGYALNGDKWPQLILTIRKVERVTKLANGRYEGVVLADFTCRGITQPKRLAVTATYLRGRAEERTNGQLKGDLLILRTQFEVSRKAHGISSGIPDDLVGDKIKVGVAVVGIHPTAVPAPKVDARYEVEYADRDDPAFLQVEQSGDRFAIRTGGKTLNATRVGEKGLRFEPNDLIGEATGEFDDSGNGFVRTKEGTIVLRGRKVDAFTDRPRKRPTGTGLPFLDLPARMLAVNTAGVAVMRRRPQQAPEFATYGTLASGEGDVVRQDTTFQVGTMSAPVLHLALLHLAQQRRVSLAQSVNEILGEKGIPDGPNGWGNKVSVGDLLRGTGGFAFNKSGGYAPSDQPEAIEIAAPEVAPGSKSGVSRINELLIERIVCKVGGRSLDEVVRREVFDPLGMRDSHYGDPDARSARPHYSSGEPTLSSFHRYVDAGGNGLWTSARDFTLVIDELTALLNDTSGKLIKDLDLVRAVDTPKSTFGVQKGEGGLCYLGGDPYGYFCEFFLKPKTGESVLVLQNRMMGWNLANAVRDAAWAPTKPVLMLPQLGGGEAMSLEAIQGQKKLVVLFLNEQCGVTVHYRTRLEKLVRDFSPLGYNFVAVRTGRKQFPNQPVDLPERRYLKVPFLDDASGDLMRKYQIGQSLTFVVLDESGKLRYQGGLDNAVNEKTATKTPLRDALRSLAKGQPVKRPRAEAIGCAILPVER